MSHRPPRPNWQNGKDLLLLLVGMVATVGGFLFVVSWSAWYLVLVGAGMMVSGVWSVLLGFGLDPRDWRRR